MEVVIDSSGTGVLQVVFSRSVGCVVQVDNPKVDNLLTIRINSVSRVAKKKHDMGVCRCLGMYN